tara:strand:- start:342 stop:461 length:120 start_codon:yes stop_codon:yes gene_type:complete
MEEFNNWLEDMNFEFENDFLGQNKSKINETLNENNIQEL